MTQEQALHSNPIWNGYQFTLIKDFFDLGSAIVREDNVDIALAMIAFIPRGDVVKVGRKSGNLPDFPRGFSDSSQFRDFAGGIQKQVGDPNAVIGVRGSSVTGQKFDGSGPFDASSDVDMFIASDVLVNRLESMGISPSANGIVNQDKFMEVLDEVGLGDMVRKAQEEIGHEISISVITQNTFGKLTAQ